jgi:hypothetical protein
MRTIALAALVSTTLLTSMMARADTQAPMSDCSEIHEIIYDLSPAELVPMCHAAMRTMRLGQQGADLAEELFTIGRQRIGQ